jgi:Acetylornithine deacetylase/Succinyl-diaminopimelate desuccinylase and related deacylases
MRKEELRTYIENHESEMIEDLKSLIRIPSEKQAAEPGKPFGAPAAEALAQGIEILEKYGFAVTNYDNYAIAADFNQEEKGLDILAHLDVVPAGEGWQETDPFIPAHQRRKNVRPRNRRRQRTGDRSYLRNARCQRTRLPIKEKRPSCPRFRRGVWKL